MPQPELSTLPEIDYYGRGISSSPHTAVIHVHPPGDAESVMRAYVDADGFPVCRPVPTRFLGYYGEPTFPDRELTKYESAFVDFVEYMAVGLQDAARSYARQQEMEKGNGVRRMLDVAPATLPRRR